MGICSCFCLITITGPMENAPNVILILEVIAGKKKHPRASSFPRNGSPRWYQQDTDKSHEITDDEKFCQLMQLHGPLIMATLAELYGKLNIYHIANILFLNLWIGEGANSSNTNMLVAFRCKSGMMVESTILSNATVGDMFAPE